MNWKILFAVLYLAINVNNGQFRGPANRLVVGGGGSFYAGNDETHADVPVKKPAIPPWLFPECPGGRVEKRPDGLYCCHDCKNTCVKMQRTKLQDSSPLLAGSPAQPVIVAAPILPANDPGVPSNVATPTCPAGRVIESGSLKLCCTGSGNSETCKPILITT